MNRRERLLYHQIHPAKLLTDVGTAGIASVVLWQHHPLWALIVGFVPSVIASAVLVQWGDLEPYRDSRLGRYIRRFMTRGVELARLAGLIPLWGGAWLRRPAIMAVGVAWILGCWLRGVASRGHLTN